MQKIGQNDDKLWQHQGYGAKLLAEAEMIAKAAAINRNFKEKDGEANGRN